MTPQEPVEILFPLFLAAVHLAAGRLRDLPVRSHRYFESFSGGVATAYVFLMVLPKLASQQKALAVATSDFPVLEYLYHHAYLVGMLGFVVYYALNAVTDPEASAVSERGRRRAALAGLAFYNLLVGDAVAVYSDDLLATALATLALGLHVLGLDDVAQRKVEGWPRLSRWLAASVVAGWLMGSFVPIPPALHAILSAFLAGGIIIHVVLYELPHDRRPGAFFAGVAIFALLTKLSLLAMGVEGGI